MTDPLFALVAVFIYQFRCEVYELSQGSYKKLQPFFKDFSRTPLDFQGAPTRNIISRIVQNCTFPVHCYKAIRIEM